MHPWPTQITKPVLPTIPQLEQIPASYYRLVHRGIFADRYFLPTAEPTSEAPDGVSLHALATVGPRLTAPLPDHLVPFAQDGARYFVFDLNAGAAVRYIDTEVDQWLTIAPTFDDFWTQLQHRKPIFAEGMSKQAFTHFAVIAAPSDVEPALEYAREFLPLKDCLEWLLFFAQQADEAKQATALDEYAFLRRLQREHLSRDLVQPLDDAFSDSAVAADFFKHQVSNWY
ncbi:SMI1/KNR4 family protein [Lacticaseibacillus mingshuiensis]|uniref:SMI1/KNR4 family protein n=1 Tax=Lacticaseibacillus mingshuiensis TaxID=2799574 RepID=A0ABW4CJY8_9LACO|nr:SMI1/KNR4 family protein [Lacticaseibacillus mingshuiensis]